MRISIEERNGLAITYRVERETGHYNNIVETVVFNPDEVVGLSEDQVLTMGYMRIKPLAKRVFEAIEPCDEVDNPEGFKMEELPTPEPLPVPIPEPDPLLQLQPTWQEIEQAEFELKTITLLTELGVIQ